MEEKYSYLQDSDNEFTPGGYTTEPTDILASEENKEIYNQPLSEQERDASSLSIDEFNFEIISNISNANVIVDGQIIEQKTPSLIQIKKSDLFIKNGRVIIEAGKQEYINYQRYEVYIVATTSVPLEEQELIKDGDDFLNLSNFDIRVDYYYNNELQSFNTGDSNLITLNFELIKREEVGDGNATFTINLTGQPESVVLERIRDGKVFPINDKQIIEQNVGEKFIVKSVDSQVYRLARIDLIIEESENNIPPEIIEAAENQSIRSEIILNQNLILNFYTQKLVYVSTKKPRIQLTKNTPIIHNINGNVDVPLVFRKNKDVTDISVIVGDEVFEFNNLEPGPLVGVKIPKQVFDRVGNYFIKAIPYSLNELKEKEVS